MEQSSKLNINWFPGHMTKAKREMQDKLKMVDMVIELRDARVPYSSKNPMIEELIQNKPRLIVLTKIDKAEKEETLKWVEQLKNESTNVICLNVTKDNVAKKVVDASKELMKEKIERQIRKGIRPRAIRSMVCGIPNVGKSTLINKLAKKKATVTGDRPGVTRSLQWVKVGNEMELLDTPGVLWPKFEDMDIAYKIAFIGSINDQILYSEELAADFIKYLDTCYPDSISSYYGFEKTDDPYKTLEEIARVRRCLGKNETLDIKKASMILMDDFRNGKIGRITLELPEV